MHVYKIILKINKLSCCLKPEVTTGYCVILLSYQARQIANKNVIVYRESDGDGEIRMGLYAKRIETDDKTVSKLKY